MPDTRTDDASPAVPGFAMETPIAVIGIGCRFPDGIDSADALWQALVDGRDLVAEVPPDRWDAGALYDPEPGVPGRLPSRRGGFIDDVRGFDPAFFGLTEHEAERMDPQARLLLETACEALEHAGLRPHDLAVSARCGVFAGQTQDHYRALTDRDAPARWDAHSVTGADRSSATGRIAHLLGLHGPAVTLDSSGSSSLVAVHLACQALRSAEVDLALAGGVALDLTPESAFAATALGVLSPSGRCGAFSAGADGVVTGEGCGMVALKRLSDALAGGDRVLAVLRATGAGHRGRVSDGSSADGQRLLQEEVLARAGVDPARVGLVEAHGAGTPAGDPVEYAVLRASYGTGEEGCALGSVKTNLGHTRAAAGIAALIKAVLAVRHGRIPPNLHFSGWNAGIDPEGARLFVPTETVPWPVRNGPRLAAVSAHGTSGTSAHVLVEQAPSCDHPAPAVPDEPLLFPFSAGSPVALAGTARRIAAWLETDGADVPLRDIGHTLAHRREARPYRAAVSARSHAELAARLRGFAETDAAAARWTGTTGRPVRGPVFVFSGVGNGVGGDLLRTEPGYAAVVDAFEPVVSAEAGFSVREALTSEEPATGVRARLVLFVTQVALAAAWRDRGVSPSAVIGHGLGEVAAAVVAGALSYADGAAVVHRAAALLDGLDGAVTTARVDLAHRQVRAQLAASGVEDVTVAVVPSPSATVIHGDDGHVHSLVAAWAANGVPAEVIPSDTGLAGLRTESIAGELTAALAGVAPREPELTVYGTSAEDPYAAPAFHAAYWAACVRGPVRLANACIAALADGHRAFVEVSPHPMLAADIRENAARMGREAVVLEAPPRGEDTPGLVLRVAEVYAAGVPISFAEHADGSLADVPLPLWAKRPLWLPEHLRSKGDAARQRGRPLLGPHIRIPDAPAEHLWQADVGTAVWGWLRDYRTGGRPAMPGAGYATMALGAAADLFGEGTPCEVRDLAVRRLLPLGEHTLITARGLRRSSDMVSVEFLAEIDGRATCVASATVHRPAAPRPASRVDLPSGLSGRRRPEVYEALAAQGVEHGPSFSALAAVHPRDEDTLIGRIALPADLRADAGSFGVHPVLLHACLLAVAARLQDAPLSPLRVETLRRLGDPERAAWCEVRARCAGADVRLLDEDGGVVVELLGVDVGGTARDASAARARDRLVALEWSELPAPGLPASAAGSWLVLAEEDDRLADALTGSLGSALLASPLSYRDMGAETVRRHLGEEHTRVVMLCPAPPASVGADSAERARDRVRRLTDLVRTLSGSPTSPRLYVVTRSARTPLGKGPVNLEQAPLRAVCRVAGAEHPSLRVTHIDVSADGGDPADLVAELLADSPEDEIAWRGGGRYAARLRRAPFGAHDRLTVDLRCGHDAYAPLVHVPGDLASLELLTARRRPPGAGEIEVRVRAAGLSFHDVRAAGERGPGPFGLDCAGEVTAVGAGVTAFRTGDRVAAFGPATMASFVTLPASSAFPIPDALPYEEAATIPLAYLLATHVIRGLAGVRSGERVLIHSATGGTGMALIALARAAGARVHATAGTPERRALLRSMGVEQVHDSRTLDFAEEIRATTGGDGVDVVVNSLEGPALQASLDLLRPGGRFVDLGGSSRLRLTTPRANITYAAVDLASLPSPAGGLLREIGEEVAAGRIRPLPHTAYPVTRVTEAFTTMTERSHSGKLVVVFPSEGTVRAVVPPGEAPVARADGAYVITGGLGGAGLLVARHLAENGAGRIVVNDDPGGAGQDLAESLRRAGHDIAVVQGDLSVPSTASNLIAAAESTGLPLRGVVHAADTPGEAAVSRIDDELLDRVWTPRAVGAWHLLQAAAPAGLDWWLSFTSPASLIGYQGLAASAAADGWLEALTAHGRASGVPMRTITWETPAADRAAALDLTLRHDRAQSVYLPPEAITGDRAPFFTTSYAEGAAGLDLRAADPGTRHTRITEYIVDKSSEILRRPRAELDPDSPLTESGLDSLSAQRLRSGLERGLGIRIPTKTILDHDTPAALAAHLAAHIAGRT